MTSTCPKCGSETPEMGRFCQNCGQALGPTPDANDTSPASTPANGKKVCAGCRTVSDRSAEHCYRCGLKLPSELHTGPKVIGNPAGFWIRLGAYVIDNLLISFVSIWVTVAFTGIEAEQAISELLGTSDGLATLIVSIGIGVGYYTFTVAQWGQTIGKALLGLKVTQLDGSRLSYWRSFGRYWAYLVSTIPLGIGFVAIALSTQKRGWHDLVVGTRVVNVRI